MVRAQYRAHLTSTNELFFKFEQDYLELVKSIESEFIDKVKNNIFVRFHTLSKTSKSLLSCTRKFERLKKSFCSEIDQRARNFDVRISRARFCVCSPAGQCGSHGF